MFCWLDPLNPWIPISSQRMAKPLGFVAISAEAISCGGLHSRVGSQQISAAMLSSGVAAARQRVLERGALNPPLPERLVESQEDKEDLEDEQRGFAASSCGDSGSEAGESARTLLSSFLLRRHLSEPADPSLSITFIASSGRI